jgi:hypothetical protein
MNGAKKSAFWRLEKHAQLSQVFVVKKHHENRKIDLCHSIPGLATILLLETKRRMSRRSSKSEGGHIGLHNNLGGYWVSHKKPAWPLLGHVLNSGFTERFRFS